MSGPYGYAGGYGQSYPSSNAGPSTSNRPRRQSSEFDFGDDDGLKPPATQTATSSYESFHTAPAAGTPPQSSWNPGNYGGLGFGHPTSSPQRPPRSPKRSAEPPLHPELPYPNPTSPSYSSLSPMVSTPPRERLPSSSSMTSVNGTLRGNRAPAPAALDLSPNRRQDLSRYAGMNSLGQGPTAMEGQGRRVVTEPMMGSNNTARVSRPLPQPPVNRSQGSMGPPAIPFSYANAPFKSYPSTAPTTPQMPPSFSLGAVPLAVPLSAVGPGRMRDSMASTDRRTLDDDGRPSWVIYSQYVRQLIRRIDSYYLSSSPQQPHASSLSPIPDGSGFSPSTPGVPDPATLDRAGLMGLGELATPRWNTSTLHQHMRTPSMPQSFGTSPMNLADPLHVGSAPTRNWARGESGLGLGVGVMPNVQEEGEPSRRQRAMSQQSPPRAPPERRSSRDFQTNRSKRDSPPMIDLAMFNDLGFDSDIEAALAASLSLLDDSKPAPYPPASQIPAPAPAPAPAPVHLSIPPWASPPAPQPTTWASPPPPPPSLPVSPGSARQRLAARRQERQAAAQNATPPEMLQTVPPRTTSKLSPPNSADSQTFAKSSSSRKTPPSSREHPAARSPSMHHDILRHFAPKDFSHLPPSPSSASINQFLRGSGSVNNFSSVGTPPLTTMANAQQYFPSSTSGSSSKGLQRSDSQKLKGGLSSARGWEGKDVDPETAEALRKLDGLSSTPGKSRAKNRASNAPSIGSRPGTPPKSRPNSQKALNSRPSVGSIADERSDSPTNAWVDLINEVPAVPPKGRFLGSSSQEIAKRESASSTSFVGTPNSRDSHSLPTSATTPSSSTGPKPTGRRASAGSEGSGHSDPAEATFEKVGEVSVPPVPPLPAGYAPRPGPTVMPPTGFVNLQDSPPERQPERQTDISPSASIPLSSDGSLRKMNKKWSFSSALNLRLNSKESTKERSASPTTSTGTPQIEVPPDQDSPGWSEIGQNDLPPVPARMDSEGDSINGSQSTLSAPPAPPSPTKPAPSTSKRMTASSIPFFRRASSSSMQPKVSPTLASQPLPDAQKIGEPVSRIPSSGQKKSGLGGHLHSMLRGSASKRGLAQTAAQPEPQTAPIRSEAPKESASLGWGRSKGKTLSMSGPIGRKVSAPSTSTEQGVLKPVASVDSSLIPRASAASDHSEATINGAPAKSALPAIVGSPSVRPVASTSSLNVSSASVTPTKIPRIASRNNASPATNGTASNSGYAYLASSRSNQTLGAKPMADTSSIPDLSRVGMGISEFGSMNAENIVARHTSSEAHRSRLLAPMATRAETKRMFAKPAEAPARRAADPNVPPSRRHMPMPPSTLTNLTASAAAKRASRDFKPPTGRRDSKDTPSDSGSAEVIKPSKSLHSKLVVPPTSRIPSSSSVGAAATFRKGGLVADSPSSPAEDDEAQADAEMAAYIARRKQRRANGNKKDDLADIMDFPEDTAPAEAISQRAYVSKNLSSMTDYERKEVLDFDHIYFVPTNRIARPPQPGGATYNYGFDDERGDYIVVEGDHLCYRYEVTSVLGKGSFGQVLGCRDHKTGKSVAVKIIRNKKRFHQQALVEVKILEQLVEWDPEDIHRSVRMTDHFYFRQHLCIVTELLSINLYELIKANQFAGFSTILIRRFTTQMLAALQLMRSHRIVHCDMKPENVLLCHPSKSSIKVIDFGSSCLENEKVYTYIQSRFYRSPEVILGMNYAMAIDMWSLGCILAELYTGVPIFPGENEQEQLACIMEVLGPPDAHLVKMSTRKKLFFDATGAPRPFVNAKGKRRRPSTKTLTQVLKCNDELFVDFIGKCLIWDPDKRMKPGPAMRHPWILAGRRRAAPSAERRTSERGSFISNSSRTISDFANGKSKSKDLVISPPTPLVARQPGSSLPPSSSSRIGQTLGSSRFGQQSVRNSMAAKS